MHVEFISESCFILLPCEVLGMGNFYVKLASFCVHEKFYAQETCI